jgi:hypothetical protein
MSPEPGVEPVPPAELLALAEVDAGLPDAAEAARGRVHAEADARSAAVLAALAATRAELAALPTPEPPPEVAARWAAALAAEGRARGTVAPAAGPGPGADGDGHPAARGPGAGPARRPRIRRPHRSLLAAAALVALVALVAGVLTGRAADPRIPTLAGVDLVAAGTAAVGTHDLGALADPGRRTGCLRAVVPSVADLPLLGGRRVVLDGRPAVLLVLATGTLGRLRLVAVDADCTAAGGTLLADTVVG